MYKFPVGILLESFRLPLEEALKAASNLGVQGVQIYATTGDLAPENLSPARRREILSMAKDQGLVISAVCGDLGQGFGQPAANPGLVEKSKRILDLSKDWDCGIVTTHIGVVPPDKEHPRYAIMQDACGQLARYADSVDAKFAVETGPETSAVLKGFLDSLSSRGVSVNLDPANLVMVTGDDPVQAVHNLKDYIVHTHAKDGIKIYDRDPELVYHVREDALVTDPSFLEVPLGEGGVDFPRYLKALEEIGYRGFLTIEREVGDSPQEDIKKAVDFLKNLMA